MAGRKGKVLSPDSNDDLMDILQAIEDTLRNGSVPGGLVIPADEKIQEKLRDILTEIVATQHFALSIAQGDLSQELAMKGHMAGSLKTLQSSLRHLTWQAGQIAGGDLSQRVHFMGEFSNSFNAMVEHLAEDEINRDVREAELKRVNAALEDEVAERRKTEDALRESEERYRILFDESPVPLWEEDFSAIRSWLDMKKGEGITDFRAYFTAHMEDVISCVRMVNVTRINRASMVLFGAHSLQEFSDGLSSIFTRESYDTFREELIALSRGKTGFECEIPLLTVQGEQKIALLKMIVVPGFELTLGKVVISLLDITERKKMENALRLANKKITMLSSITRHDIRNQLLVLHGLLGLSRLKTNDSELLRFIEKEERAAEAIGSQIEFTKYYEELGVNAPEWQDIREIIQTVRSQLPLSDTIGFSINLPAVKVFADSLIEKVFYNLLENTLRHGERVSRIRISFEETDRGAEIVYEDDGVGVSHEDKPHLFQKGFGKNTGLGLFLSQEIMTITGLTIRETGEPGKGVRFVIAVPKEGYRIRQDPLSHS